MNRAKSTVRFRAANERRRDRAARGGRSVLIAEGAVCARYPYSSGNRRRCGTEAARVDRTAPNATMEGAGALVVSVGRVAASGSATRRASGSSACASGRPWRPVTALVGAPRSGARRADVRGSFAVLAVAAGGGERRVRGDRAGPARRSRASLANGDGARASSRGSSPRDTSPAGEDRSAPRRGAGAPGASRASVPGSASGDDADAAPRSRASSRDAGSARASPSRATAAPPPPTPPRAATPTPRNPRRDVARAISREARATRTKDAPPQPPRASEAAP